MSMRTTPSERSGRPGPLDLYGQVRHQRPVVEGLGQWIEPGGLDEGGCLAGQPTLRRAEDQEEEDRRDERRAEGDRHDVPSDLFQLVENRDGVPPDPDNGPHRAVCADRHVLAEDRRRREAPGRRTSVRRRQDFHAHFARRGTRCSPTRVHRDAGQPGLARGDDRPVQAAEFHTEDLVRTGEGGELRLECSALRLGGPDRRVEIAQRDGLVEDRTDRRGIAGHDRVQRAGGEVQRDHERLGGRGDPDDRQEHAEDENEQQRAARPPL